MPPVPESPAGPDFSVRVVEDDGRPVAGANDYDSFAEAYTAETEANLINGYYMRPAILDLAGDVAGRRILDAGCGSGPLSAALRDRGAVVTGLDSSAAMLELARLRLGPRADLRLADLGGPLPFGGACHIRRPFVTRQRYCRPSHDASHQSLQTTRRSGRLPVIRRAARCNASPSALSAVSSACGRDQSVSPSMASQKRRASRNESNSVRRPPPIR